MITVTSTKLRRHFGKYLNFITSGIEIIITKNGKEVGRLVPVNPSVTPITDSLTGILKGNYNLKER